MKNKDLRGALIALGTMIVAAIVGISVGGFDNNAKDAIGGLAIGIVSAGIGLVIATIISRKNKNLKKNMEIQENDERIHYINLKANSLCYHVYFYGMVIGLLLSLFMDIRLYTFTLIAVIAAPVVNIGAVAYYNKQM